MAATSNIKAGRAYIEVTADSSKLRKGSCAMNATGEALNSTIKPMVERVVAVINSFTRWIAANRGLVTSIAVTAVTASPPRGGYFTVVATADSLEFGFHDIVFASGRQGERIGHAAA